MATKSGVEKTEGIYQDWHLQCIDCGNEFIYRAAEQRRFEKRGFAAPKRCPDCRKRRRSARENSRIAGGRLTKSVCHGEIPPSYHVASLSDIKLHPDQTLYVIGNGFDLMHGIPSNYYSFGKTLGKNNSLRYALETYVNVADLWGDFENALGHLNISMLTDPQVLDMWLDDFGAYDPDAQAADFYAAAESSVNSVETILNDLPRRFRQWVEGLKCSTNERPLAGFIVDAKVLCFNYTEFVETLYGVSTQNVCYIHGCRRKKKGFPKEELVLGHEPNSNEREWNQVDIRIPRFKNKYKKYILESAMDVAIGHLTEYDKATTKQCQAYIQQHQDFFDSLQHIDTIVVIGHSLSRVDWDYFDEILTKSNVTSWIITYHSDRDIENIEAFIQAHNIARNTVTLIRL